MKIKTIHSIAAAGKCAAITIATIVAAGGICAAQGQAGSTTTQNVNVVKTPTVNVGTIPAISLAGAGSQHRCDPGSLTKNNRN